MNRSLLRLLGAFLLGIALWAPTPAHAARSFCVDLAFDYWDANQGEDYLTQSSPYGVTRAANHWGSLKRGTTTVWSGYLNNTGCTPPISGSGMSSGTYTFAIASVLLLNSAQVVIVPDDSYTDGGQWRWLSWNLGTLSASTGTTPVTSHFLQSTNTTEPSFSVSAMLTSPVASAPDSPLVAQQVYTIYADQECPGLISCAQETRVFLGQYPGFEKDAFSKWLAMHEFGHATNEALMGYPLNDPDFMSSATLCNCSHTDNNDPGAHCMQSKTQHTLAREEGWGNFVAAYLFNNASNSDAWFAYYGRIHFPPASSEPVDPPVPWDSLNPSLWMETHCSGSSTGRAVEADWMGFFYKLHSKTSSKYTFGNIRSVFLEACPGSGKCDSTDDVKWDDLRDAAATLYSATKAQYFEDTLEEFGVDH